MRIATLNAGVGNVRSVLRALERTGPSSATIIATSDPEEVRRADVLVVPGQGSFGAFADALEGGLREALLERIHAGTPYLGICLGLQILFQTSEEAPSARGLGVTAGHVRRLEPGIDSTGRPRALPHIGWNTAEPRLGTIVAPAHYYFAHSYVAAPVDTGVVLATTTYGETFPSAVAQDNIVGVQFHPEKSQRAGLALLERFFARLGTRNS